MNPYQEIIDWLRSPAGERWSESRLRRARRASQSSTPTAYTLGWSGTGPVALPGVFNIKED